MQIANKPNAFGISYSCYEKLTEILRATPKSYCHGLWQEPLRVFFLCVLHKNKCKNIYTRTYS